MKRNLLLLCLLMISLIAVFPALAQDETIEVGDSVEGELNAETPSVRYTFEGESGQSLVITLTSPAFDTFLSLEAEDGTQIGFNDDSGPGNLNSRIGPITLSDDGEYTIVADSYAHYYNTDASTIEGAFTVSLQEVEASRIEYTQEVEGELTDETRQAFYTFRGQEGDIVNITMASSDFSGYLTLTQESVTLTSADGTYSADGSARISGFRLPSTGDYLLTAGTTADGTGDFTLTIDRLDVVAIEYGDVVTETLDDNTRLLYFTFEGTAGDVVNMTVEGDGIIDTTLTVNGPDTYQLMFADDTNELDPAITNLFLPQTGIYTVLVQPYSTGDEGEVTFTLEAGELPSLNDETQTVRTSSTQTRQLLSFTGNSGENIRLHIEVVKGGPASPTITVLQQQQSVTYLSGSTVWGTSVDFSLLYEGQAIVQIDEYSYTDITLDISIERLGERDEESEEAEASATPTAASEPAVEPTAVEAEEEDTDEDEADEVEETEEPAVEPTVEPTEAPVETEEPAATEEPEATEAA